MSQGRIAALRQEYHRRICEDVMRVNDSGVPNNADKVSPSSVRISKGILEKINIPVGSQAIPAQTVGRRFEETTKDFLEKAFSLLHHLRPGEWRFSVGGSISDFEQYRHLHDIKKAIEENRQLKVAFGDYIIKPDIVVCRVPLDDEEINERELLLDHEPIAICTPLRRKNSESNLLHASISCKWTIRSDRSQNARTEGLNLIRNRKGGTPRIVVVVSEPLPARIASLAFGTGDIDCVYHFALQELKQSAPESDLEMLNTLIEGGRLRDISDLPFDLAI